MANLSQNDRNIIAEHPLDTWLDHLQDPLRKAEQSYKPGSLSHDSIASISDQGPQKVISRVLGTLLVHEVALNLRSKIGSDNVASDLSELFIRVQRGRYNYEHYRALSRLVIKKGLPTSTFGTPSSTLSSPFLERPLRQAFLLPSMALPSRFHPPRSKALSKLENWWKHGSLKR
ncbi:hypothetical protein N7G274_003821 [Stereocaulon virgatum]|uniref:Uncharacterized protein n=1 Tax=Stereocaulon virgatum TaxID=373712 RepID=A0ABR4ACD4_9LECA